MRVVVLDFESFYSRDFSLSKLTVPQYVLDDRFEAIMCGYMVLGEMDKPETIVLDRAGVRRLKEVLAGPVTVVAHNAAFDCAILAWRYGIVPDRMFCTMMASRVELISHTKSMSLAKTGPAADAILSVADGHRLPPKGTEVVQMKGLRRGDMTPDMLAKYSEYCANDVMLCARLYEYFTTDKSEAGRMSDADIDCLHETIRKAVVPQLQLDIPLLNEHAERLAKHKETLLKRCGLDDRKRLMSNDMFAAMLRDLGVEPPQKISPKTNKVGYAFAKTDKEMQQLYEDPPSPAVATLVAARLGHKSTIEETRVQRLVETGNAFLAYHGPRGGNPWLPFPLMYFGAKTGRMSGTGATNLQNLTRGSTLRQAVIAPQPGYKLVVGDLSQIEARLLAYVAGEKELLQQFANGQDVYSEFASSLYNKPINADDNPDERFVGKTAVLGLGYGCGSAKFHEMVRIQRGRGFMSEAEANGVVRAYRNQFRGVTGLWKWMDTVLEMENEAPEIPSAIHYDGDMIVPGRANGTFYLELCGERKLWYPNLRKQYDEARGNNQWVYDTNRAGSTSLYGGKMVENIIQALAALVIRDAELRMLKITSSRKMPIHAAGQVHDELIYVVPEPIAEAVAVILRWALVQQPAWLAPFASTHGKLPLDCKVSIADDYKSAK